MLRPVGRVPLAGEGGAGIAPRRLAGRKLPMTILVLGVKPDGNDFTNGAESSIRIWIGAVAGSAGGEFKVRRRSRIGFKSSILTGVEFEFSISKILMNFYGPIINAVERCRSAGRREFR